MALSRLTTASSLCCILERISSMVSDPPHHSTCWASGLFEEIASLSISLTYIGKDAVSFNKEMKKKQKSKNCLKALVKRPLLVSCLLVSTNFAGPRATINNKPFRVRFS